MANDNNTSIQEADNLNHKHPLLNMSPDPFNMGEEGRGCCYPSEKFATAATMATITSMVSAGIGFFCCGANAAVTGIAAAAGAAVGSLVGAGCTEEINTCVTRCEQRMAPY